MDSDYFLTKICYNLKKNEGNVIPATGRVKWARAINREAVMDEDTGIEFINISSNDIENLISGLSRSVT